MITPENTLRCVRLSPYRKGTGPSFSLVTFDEGIKYHDRDRISYVFKQGKETIFEGNDFGPSPMHAWDSDETISTLLGFLTLRPGDTDAEYFEKYTPRQMQFADEHAEALACYVSDRFGDR